MKIFTWKQRFIVLLVTVGMIVLFAVIGAVVGSAFGSVKIGAVIGIILSYPATQILLTRVLKRLHKKDPTSPTVSVGDSHPELPPSV